MNLDSSPGQEMSVEETDQLRWSVKKHKRSEDNIEAEVTPHDETMGETQSWVGHSFATSVQGLTGEKVIYTGVDEQNFMDDLSMTYVMYF